MFPITPSFKIAQVVLLHGTGGLPELQIRNLKMTFSPEPLVQIQNNFTKLVSLDTLYQNCTNGSALLNKRAARAPDKKYL